MEETELPDNVVCEILLRVPSTDAAALFRCAATCKQWRAVVADLSFLRRHWPENARHPSSLLGFFDRPRDNQDSPFFFPTPPGLVFGARRRSLASFVSGAPGGILSGAVPLAARGGLLLVRLTAAGDSLHLAICDLLTGTCDVLPPLECRVSQCQAAVLSREDCCSLQGRTPLTGYSQGHGYSTLFKVLAMVMGSNDPDCYLYTFSSSEPNWSEPRKCLDEVLRRDKFAVRILMGANRVTICRGVAYWLGSYRENPWTTLPCYFTFGVDVKTGQISITDLSIPANEFGAISHSGLMLTVTVDGMLSLLHLQKEGLRLNTWRRRDDGTWLQTKVVELKSPQQVWNPVHVTILSGEKSGSFFMGDVYGRVHKTDPETGVMEDVSTKMFQDGLSTVAVPIEIDWPALFMSRLAKR